MPITIDDSFTPSQGAMIKVVGVGGAGSNAVNTMIDLELSGVEFISVNTDIQALSSNKAKTHIQIGKKITEGLGAGADPNVGEKSVQEDSDSVKDAIKGSHMVFITAGMGGGTGTGAAPVVAKIAKETGALTVGIVTKPFKFEGSRRISIADKGIENLRNQVDTLIVIPNQKLMEINKGSLTIKDAFREADRVLYRATKGISDIIKGTGYINVDFADVRAIMTNMGDAIMGIGTGKGEKRAIEAAQHAITSPLLDDVSLKGALGVLINITAGSNFLMSEVDQATEYIRQATSADDANVIFGVVLDESFTDEIQITVIATGFNRKKIQEIDTFESENVKEEKGFLHQEPQKQPIKLVERQIPDRIEVFSSLEKSKREGIPYTGPVKVDKNSTDIEIPTFLRQNKRN
ncbi:cell division protein FtsZ [bacterium]|nr:cell division protein FtsZ [bacterium]